MILLFLMLFRKLTSRQKSPKTQPNSLPLQIESLEDRVMLSAVTAGGADNPDDPSTASTGAAEVELVESPSQNQDDLQLLYANNEAQPSQMARPVAAPVAAGSGMSFPVTESNGVATVDLTDGSMINDAFMFLTDYVDNNGTVQSGVVNISANTTFSESLTAQDNVVLNIADNVTLTLDTLLDPLADGPALKLNNTSHSGITGGGTFDINGNARQGIYGVALNNVRVGNVDAVGANPTKLKVVGWQYGVFFASTRNTAATDITITNLEISLPNATHVEYPITITNRPSANGLWVDGLTVNNMVVDGGQPDGLGGIVGGAHDLNNGFTADQIAIQGVHNATLTDVSSLNGGENGIAVAWGSKNVTLTNFTIDGADAHAFNIGGSGMAVDVTSEAGFVAGQQLRGVTSGTTAEVLAVFAGRVWVKNAGGNQFQVGEVLEVTDTGVTVSTSITGTNINNNITIDNATTTNSGLNRKGDVNSDGELLAFSDVFIQQANGVVIKDSNFHSIGRADPAGGFANHYGVNGTISSFELSGNTFHNYGSNQTPVVVSINSTHLQGTPDTNNIHGTPGEDDITGTLHADVIDGEESDDRLLGRGGNDTIHGDAGDDTLFGEEGDDQLFGDAGADVINAGDGDDYVEGGDGEDRIFGFEGADTILGGANDDYLSGGDGDDDISGGTGEDTLVGGVGNDTLAGGDDADLIRGQSGNDILHGDGGDDQLQGDAGDDTITGGLGVDRLTGGSGADNLDGGEGNDSLFGDADNDTLTGGAGDDRLEGGGGNDALHGGAGIDILRGDAGDDVLNGGADNDSLDGGDGDDQLNGDGGDDNLRGGVGADAFDGGDGIDAVDYRNATSGVTADLQNSGVNAGAEAIGDTYTNVEDIFGTSFDDVLSGDSGANTLNGETGSDILSGRGGNDVINAGLGDDTLIGGAGADTLMGSDGFDTASYHDASTGVTVDLATPGNNTGDALGDTYSGIEKFVGSDHGDSLLGNGSINELEGGSGNDILHGRGGEDILRGGAGDDVLQGDEAGDALFGGDGNDTASYAGANSTVKAYLDDAASNAGIAAGDTFDSIENLSGGDFNDTLVGDANANTLDGGIGNDNLSGLGGDDVLIGGEGDDELDGGTGADALQGGNGTDIASYRDATTGLTIDFATPANNTGDAAGDTFIEVENIYGSEFGDVISGDNLVNELRGYAGEDTLHGRGGDDTLTGGDGNDVLIGGSGADVISGGDGVDTASYADAATGIVFDLDNMASNTGDAVGDTFIGIEKYRGSEFADTIGGSGAVNDLDGGAGDDSLDGRGGNDTLRGGDGDDLLEGGRGSDALFGGDGIDTATFIGATSTVRAYLDDAASNAGIASGDTFDSIENLIGGNFNDTLVGDANANMIRGEAGNDAVEGAAGDDVLFGGDGDDRINGGSGDDIMSGGQGDDRFIFEAGWGHDTITDFANGSEKIDLRGIAGIDEVDDLTITDVAGGVLISFNGSTIKLDGLQASDIDRPDFFMDVKVNDNPTTTSVGETGSVTEDGVVTDSGTIAFADVDSADTHTASASFVSSTHSVQLGTLTASVTSATPAGEVIWNYAVDNTAIEFLDSGETVTENFVVTISDDKGNLVDVDVTITINGNSSNNTFIINTVGDKPDVNLADGLALDEDGNTSLRAAIMQANASSPGTISELSFSFPDGSGPVYVIQLDSALPDLESEIHLDGEISTGEVVEIDGSGISAGVVDGLRVEADNVEITGIILLNFSSDGIEVKSADNVVISNVLTINNGGAGVRFNDATNSTLTQSTALGNGTSGVQLVGSTTNQANVISNNRLGIGGNEIAYGNRTFGIQVRTDGNVISDNVISGNSKTGLIFSGANATNNVITGNKVGTDSSGNQSVANGAYGILVTGGHNNTFGGSAESDRNLVSGNSGSGFALSNASTGNHIENNYIGLNASGTSAVGNGSNGLYLRGNASNNSFTGNYVAGNSGSQISLVAGGTTANTFTANYVGFGEDFTPVAGSNVAILIKSPGNTFGGSLESDANFIVGSTTGISLNGLSARDNLIQNNRIGIDAVTPVGNDHGMVNGIQFLQLSRNNVVMENVIAYSSGDAIRSPSGGNGNTFSQNTLYENQTAIDLAGNGANGNDAGDSDTGPNQRQNSPVIVGDIQVVPTSGNLADITITYSLNSSTPHTTFPVTAEFFFSDSSGRDAFFVGSDVFTEADSTAGTPKTITLTGVVLPGYPDLSSGVASATDENGNTSELSVTSPLLFPI